VLFFEVSQRRRCWDNNRQKISLKVEPPSCTHTQLLEKRLGGGPLGDEKRRESLWGVRADDVLRQTLSVLRGRRSLLSSQKHFPWFISLFYCVFFVVCKQQQHTLVVVVLLNLWLAKCDEEFRHACRDGESFSHLCRMWWAFLQCLSFLLVFQFYCSILNQEKF
jgi:hypothetical protein